jgi:iron complex transport system substrate-binding protein
MAGRLAWLAAALALAGCDAPPAAQRAEAPRRIVSLDFCADQYVLGLADRDRIVAVSTLARDPVSYMREAAAGIAQVRPRAEDALALRPDLIVRTYGGGPGADALFARAGVAVLDIPFVNDIAAVRAAITLAAEALGAPERGARLIAGMDARLAAAAPAPGAPVTALYMTPSGATSGPGTLTGAIIEAAGLENFEGRPGWRELPLERLARAAPDMVAAGFFDGRNEHLSAWSAMRHPVARAQIATLPVAALKGAWIDCGGWFLADAVETLAATRDRVRAP